jgi:SAM-dependent methyltransferase
MNQGPFEPSALFYDQVYQHLDYPGTAALVEGLIRERNPGVRSLLDMSCGTGLHLKEWRSTFDEVALHQADFTDFDLGRRYDAVTCMFSSIGYAATPDRLDAAIAAMARHLEPGGVLVVEPWLSPAMIQPPFLRTMTSESDDMVILRSTRHRYEGDPVSGGVSDMEFAYVVTTDDGSQFFTEQHLMGVYPPDRYVQAIEAAGLRAEFLEGLTDLGRGLAVGVAAASS